MVSPVRRREVVAQIQRDHPTVSERRACKMVGVNRSSIRYRPCEQRMSEEARVTNAIKSACAKRHQRRYGYRRIAHVLREDGWLVNHKRVRRIMHQEGLLKAPRKRKSRARGHSANSCTILPARGSDHVWTYDFVKIRLADGTGLRMLSVVDEHTRFAIRPLIAKSIPADAVIDHLAELFLHYGIPKIMRSDNGSEFTAVEVTSWLGKLDVDCAFVAPASPWENGYVETFHDKLRDELLSQEVLFTLKEAKVAVYDWIDHYNHDRPHAGLKNRTPAELRYGVEAMSSIVVTPEGSNQQK